ncbi:MAG: hypothetical protein WA269_03475 [Candidatus Udaeobacter sp.]
MAASTVAEEPRVIIEGLKWTDFAIDHFTGQILDKQIEEVVE